MEVEILGGTVTDHLLQLAPRIYAIINFCFLLLVLAPPLRKRNSWEHGLILFHNSLLCLL